MSKDYPAIFENTETGELTFVPNIQSGPVGLWRRSAVTVEEYEARQRGEAPAALLDELAPVEPEKEAAPSDPASDPLAKALGEFDALPSHDPVNETPEGEEPLAEASPLDANPLAGWANR